MILLARTLSALALSLATPKDPERFVTLPVIADQSIALHETELDLNLGNARRIRIKGNQHIAALAFDTRAIAGRQVIAATLIAAQGDHTLEELTIATIQVPWNEERATARAPGTGATGWGFPGAPFPTVTLGLGGSLASRTHAKPRGGNYHWNVDPDLVHALALGAAFGLSIQEHGSDLGRTPSILSRESGTRGARLLVELGERKQEVARPAAPEILRVFEDPREELVFLEVRAPASGFVYDVELDGRELSRHLVPFVEPDRIQRILLGGRSELAGREHQVKVRVRDRGGRPSGTVDRSFVGQELNVLEAPPVERRAPAKRSERRIVLPMLDRLDAAREPLELDDEDWLLSNEVWDGEVIRCRAARGEVIGFSVLSPSPVREVRVELGGLRVDVFRACFVETEDRRLPDPLLPFDSREATPTDGTASTWLAFDLYVPFEETRHLIEGTLTIDGRELPLELGVRDFALPREVSFVCELNTYGLPEHLETFDELQRIAYDHRCHVNLLPYPHRTARPGSRQVNLDMRLRDGRKMDEVRFCDIEPGDRTTYWDDFVAAFGTYLDGTRFADGHRGPIAPPGFYLPFHESWPLHVRPYFSGAPDAFEAFREHPEYAETFVALVADFQRLARRRGWTKTGFQIYLNAKGSLSDEERGPWTLDEPASFWDFRALAFYGELVRRALEREGGTRLRFRVDLSRPQYDRGQLAGDVAPLWVTNLGTARDHPWMMRERRARQGIETWYYGTNSDVHESARRIQAFVLLSWLLGARGVVPWQTVDRTGEALKRADQLALFVFEHDTDGGSPRVRKTLRLAAYRRAQQDVEYLELLAARPGTGIGAVRDLVRTFLDETYLNGCLSDGRITPEPWRFHALRESVAALLER